MAQLAFTARNDFESLQFLEARSPDELLSLLKQIKTEAKIVTIYEYGNRHIAWIKLAGELVKIKAKKETKK